MKILAAIPVERVDLSPCSFTYRMEVKEVEVIRVTRWPATRNPALKRFHYQADIKRHPDLLKEAVYPADANSYRVNIIRRGVNDKWIPPEFPDGSNVFEVKE